MEGTDMTDQTKIPAPEPVALMLQHRDGRKTLHPYAEYATAYRDTAMGQNLLITLESAEAYAAALAEKARQDERETQAAERAKLTRVLKAAVELVCAPAWAGISDEDCELERVLRECGYVRAG